MLVSVSQQLHEYMYLACLGAEWRSRRLSPPAAVRRHNAASAFHRAWAPRAIVEKPPRRRRDAELDEALRLAGCDPATFRFDAGEADPQDLLAELAGCGGRTPFDSLWPTR